MNENTDDMNEVDQGIQLYVAFQSKKAIYHESFMVNSLFSVVPLFIYNSAFYYVLIMALD